VLFSSITSAPGGGPGPIDNCAANPFSIPLLLTARVLTRLPQRSIYLVTLLFDAPTIEEWAVATQQALIEKIQEV
jgi:hypothetical protein